MRFAILGPGGVGGLVGAALARAGHPVTLLVRPASAAAHPPALSVSSAVLGRFEVPVEVATRPPDGVDAVWIAVKATQLDEALTLLPPERVTGELLIPLLNGVDHIALLRGRYPAASVVAGSMQVEAERGGPGSILQLSPFADIRLAADGAARPRVEAVAAAVAATGLACTVVDGEATMLWTKLAFLAPLALTTTASDSPLGTVRSHPEWSRRLDACLTEAVQAARARGASVDRTAVAQRLHGAPDVMRSSMQKDVAAGRSPELDAIGGPILRAAQERAFDASTTRELMAMIAARVARSG